MKKEVYAVFAGFYEKIVLVGIFENVEDAVKRRDEFNKTAHEYDGMAEIETVPMNEDVYMEL